MSPRDTKVLNEQARRPHIRRRWAVIVVGDGLDDEGEERQATELRSGGFEHVWYEHVW